MTRGDASVYGLGMTVAHPAFGWVPGLGHRLASLRRTLWISPSVIQTIAIEVPP